jgi:hypothetical protein
MVEHNQGVDSLLWIAVLLEIRNGPSNVKALGGIPLRLPVSPRWPMVRNEKRLELVGIESFV